MYIAVGAKVFAYYSYERGIIIEDTDYPSSIIYRSKAEIVCQFD